MLPGQTALYGRTATMHANPEGKKTGLVFSEMAHLGKINLRANKSAGKIVKSLTGCLFPPGANRFTSAGERHTIWLGPDEYLIICEAGKDDELVKSLDGALADLHHATTNLSDALSAFHLTGPAVRQVLAKGCALDLHQETFAEGDAAQTLLSLASVTIMGLSKFEFMVICRTSFSSYLYDWLTDAAIEYGVQYKK